MSIKENIISDFAALLKIQLLPRYFMEIGAEENYVRIKIPEELLFSKVLREVDDIAQSCYSRIVFRSPTSAGSRIMVYLNNNQDSASLMYPKV